MLFDGLRIEHQCRPRAVAAAGASTTIVYRSMFLSSLLRRPIQCFPLQIWLDKEPCGHPPFWKAVPKTRALSPVTRVHYLIRSTLYPNREWTFSLFLNPVVVLNRLRRSP